jgi:hypothetical protein
LSHKTGKNNPVFIDISGQKFGRLTAIRNIPGSDGKWLFACDCGTRAQLQLVVLNQEKPDHAAVLRLNSRESIGEKSADL